MIISLTAKLSEMFLLCREKEYIRKVFKKLCVMSFPEYHLIWLLCKNVRLVSVCIPCCSYRHVHWENAPEYPLLTLLLNFLTQISKFAIHIANLEIWVKEYHVVTSCL